VSTTKTLPLLGAVTPEGVGYRVTEPITASTLREVIREKWFGRVEITDGRGGNARFSALCWIDGQPVVVTGQIGGDE
jgi:hypothetical protein